MAAKSRGGQKDESSMRDVKSKEVIDFMKSEGYYRAYCRNILRSKLRRDNVKFLKRHKLLNVLCRNGIESIVCAFIWSNTPEGSDYWEQRDTELKTHFRTCKK